MIVRLGEAMRLSQMLFVELREDPDQAEISSHILLGAGYIRRLGSGSYAYLSLMWRVLQKSQIVRDRNKCYGCSRVATTTPTCCI